MTPRFSPSFTWFRRLAILQTTSFPVRTWTVPTDFTTHLTSILEIKNAPWNVDLAEEFFTRLTYEVSRRQAGR